MKLVIANTDIHQDAEGRYSLNDLREAAIAMGEKKDIRPSEWLALDRTVELAEILIKEFEGSKPIEAKAGRYGGTYVVRELVYAYAMWISPKFKLKVIRAYDDVASGKVTSIKTTVHPPKLFPDYFKVARLIGCDRNAAAISANQAVLQKTGENVLALLGQTQMEAEIQELVFNVSDLADGVSGVKMNKMLQAAEMQTNQDGRWVPTDAGLSHCRVFDTGKRHGNGTPVQQVKWFKSVLAGLSLSEAA